MLMKNKCLSLIIAILLCSCSNVKKQVMFIGERIDPSLIKGYDSYDDTFLVEAMYIKNLYFISEENARDSKSKKTFNQIINKSSMVYISIGLSDILLSVYDGKIDTSTSLFENRMEMFEFYLHELLENLEEYKDKIYIIKISDDSDMTQNAINKYNQIIVNMCEEFDVTYVG